MPNITKYGTLFFKTGLFGEGPADRRNRLRQLIAEVGEQKLKQKKEDEEKQMKGVRDSNNINTNSSMLMVYS